ncbi:MAG TPA: transposase [Geminicoccaceae bacterium]|nr:transposase [Geminicoccaceae bacterium]
MRERGYESRRHRERLAERGIANGGMRCNFRCRRLTPDDHARNQTIAPLRAPVERSFAIPKRWYGYRRVGYSSLLRNALRLLACAMNLRRHLLPPPEGQTPPRPGPCGGQAAAGPPPTLSAPRFCRLRPFQPAQEQTPV